LSLGASVGIHLVLQYPELCESLVLTGYAPVIPPKLESAMQEQYEWFLQVEQNAPDVASEFHDLNGDRWFDTLRAVLDDMTFHYPMVSDAIIKTLEVPTLVLNGSREQHERDAACHMADLSDTIRVGLIPGAGHTCNLDKPTVYNTIVQSFWDEIGHPS
jgi:pimeloyl-ACP methyl ester carboxylesterase